MTFNAAALDWSLTSAEKEGAGWAYVHGLTSVLTLTDSHIKRTKALYSSILNGAAEFSNLQTRCVERKGTRDDAFRGLILYNTPLAYLRLQIDQPLAPTFDVTKC